MTAHVLPDTSSASGRRFGAAELERLAEVIESGCLNRAMGGTQTANFEQEFADLIGAEHCVAASSGTAALHLAVAAVNPNPGDEIITTGLTDAGTLLPILSQNAIPVFADVEPDSGNLDPESVRSKITERTRAIMVVHLMGVPAKVEELREIADEHGILLIEDAAQAYLTRTRSGRWAGTVGHIGCFSLQQSKHISTGDGGLTVTDDPALARHMRLFMDKAWPRDTGERTHLFLGLNYRMTELAAAVGRAQLGRLEQVVADRKASAERMLTVVNSIEGLSGADPEGTSWWNFPVFVDRRDGRPDAFAWSEALKAHGLYTAPGYIRMPLYRTPLIAEAKTYGSSGFPIADVLDSYAEGSCPVTEELITHGGLFIVMWNENYTDEDLDFIAGALRAAAADLGVPGEVPCP